MPRGVEKSEKRANCGEILTAPAHASAGAVTDGLLAMNILRVPKVPAKTPAARALRKRRSSTQGARLELTLEMPAQRQPLEAPASGEQEREPERGVAEIDFYI